MDTLQINVPSETREFIDKQIASGQFQSASDVVVDALEKARELEAQRRLAVLLLEGLDSGPGIPVNDAWWEKRRTEILAKSSTNCE